MSENPAAVNIADEQYGRLREERHGHVDEVAGLEIEFGGAARALDDDEIILCAQAVERPGNLRPEVVFVGVIVAGIQRLPGTAINHHLRARVGFRLDQDRVHIHMRLQPGGGGLHGLGAADLAAIGTHGSIVGHILRFERGNLDAATGVAVTQRRDEQAFSG